jgi:hypothetical protein
MLKLHPSDSPSKDISDSGEEPDESDSESENEVAVTESTSGFEHKKGLPIYEDYMPSSEEEENHSNSNVDQLEKLLIKLVEEKKKKIQAGKAEANSGPSTSSAKNSDPEKKKNPQKIDKAISVVSKKNSKNATVNRKKIESLLKQQTGVTKRIEELLQSFSN